MMAERVEADKMRKR